MKNLYEIQASQSPRLDRRRPEPSGAEPSRAKANRTKTETQTLPKQNLSCISVMAVKTLTLPKLESGDSHFFRCYGITNQKMFRRKIKPKHAKLANSAHVF